MTGPEKNDAAGRSMIARRVRHAGSGRVGNIRCEHASASGVRRNESRSLRLMPEFQVNYGTDIIRAASSSIRVGCPSSSRTWLRNTLQTVPV